MGRSFKMRQPGKYNWRQVNEELEDHKKGGPMTLNGSQKKIDTTKPRTDKSFTEKMPKLELVL